MEKRNFKGFTLIELLVVATIIGILTAVAVVNYNSAQRRARDGKRKADLEAIRGALEMRKADFGSYPLSLPQGGTTWSETLNSQTYTYMQKVPQDPKSPTYKYYYSSDGSTYQLCAFLESGGGDNCGNNCGTTCNYKVVQP